MRSTLRGKTDISILTIPIPSLQLLFFYSSTVCH
ncbi:hypothetical protein CsSME_00033645 [Camellia sinensis var. sinensis]